MPVRRKQATTHGKAMLAPKFVMLGRLIMSIGFGLLTIHPAAALDQVSLQLKWRHQFQFAGYYAALEKGFYRDAGIDVEIREGGPDVDANREVADAKPTSGSAPPVFCSTGQTAAISWYWA